MMDETGNNKQDSLPEKGQTSAGDSGSTSKDTRTYTEQEVMKKISDELAKAGRDAKSLELQKANLEKLAKSLQADKEQIAKWQQEREEEELEAARGNSDALTYLQRKQALRKKEAELAEKIAQKEAEFAEKEAEIAEARELKRERLFFEIASEDGLDPQKLKDLCDKFNAQTEDQIKALAESIRPEKKAEQPKSRFVIKADSGMTTGVNDLNSLSTRELIKRGLEKK